MFFGQIIAAIIVVMLLVVWLKEWLWVPFAIVVLLFIIRLLADFYWWGKEKGKF